MNTESARTEPGGTESADARSAYARMWADVPRGLGYLAPTLFLVVAGLIVEWALLSSALGLLAVLVGVAVWVAGLWFARVWGSIEILRLRATRRPPILPPDWERVTAGKTGLAQFLAPIVDGHYWLYTLWVLLVGPIVGLVTWALTIAWTGGIVWGVVSWVQSLASVVGDHHLSRIGDASAGFLVAGVLTAGLPVVVRGLTIVQWWVARGMLGAFRSEALAGRVVQLTESRTLAAQAEGSALRRLERDIHDGPQQRLVRLQMDLAAAERQLEKDPDRSRALLAEAASQSREALEELRALSRGFAPPLLLDRGLRAALDGLAARSTVPARFVDELPADIALSIEVERNLYFVAAEALTNAAKHAGATRIDLAIRSTGDAVELTVVDDGSGGASAEPGHGLAGLDERMRGMGGVLELDSPPGGGTTVRARVPLEG